MSAEGYLCWGSETGSFPCGVFAAVVGEGALQPQERRLRRVRLAPLGTRRAPGRTRLGAGKGVLEEEEVTVVPPLLVCILCLLSPSPA